jgi:hypothetical protein
MTFQLKLTAAALGAASLLSGCIMVDADVRDNDFDGRGPATQIYGAEISARSNTVTITAPSNGCTERSHFEADVDDEGDNHFDLRFSRVQIDRCKALVPEGKQLTWSYAELGLPADARVTVMNRVSR